MLMTMFGIGGVLTYLTYEIINGFYSMITKDEQIDDTPKDIIIGDNGIGVKLAHTLVTGASGSGKSVCLISMIGQIINYGKVIGIDLKGTEFIQYYDEITYIRKEDEAIIAMKELQEEMERRLEKLIEKRVPDYNYCYDMQPICLIIDEFQTLVDNREAKKILFQLITKARATNIHLILSCQCPRSEIVEGRIKDNIINTIIFRCETQTASEIATSEKGNYSANLLKGEGHGLLKYKGKFYEFQGLPPKKITQR